MLTITYPLVGRLKPEHQRWCKAFRRFPTCAKLHPFLSNAQMIGLHYVISGRCSATPYEPSLRPIITCLMLRLLD